MTARRLIIAVVALLVLAGGAYSALWLYAAHAVRGGLAQWTEAERATGATVEYGALHIGGYPLALRLTVAAPRYVAPHGLWRWSGDGIEAEVWPWAFRTVVLHPEGRQQASFPIQGGTETVTTTDASAVITARFDAYGRFVHGTIDTTGLAIAGSIAAPDAASGTTPAVATAPAAVAPATAKGLHVELTIPQGPPPPSAGPDLPESAGLVLDVDDLMLPAAVRSPLGAHLSRIAIEAELRGTVPLGPPRAALAAWRDAGGTLELKYAALAWGPLDLSGNGTVALDDNLQPEAAATAQVRGFKAAIDALTARGLIGPRTGSFAVAALTAMSMTPPGGTPTITVPLSIQHQRFYAGPFGLMSLPAIDWPG